MAAKGTRPVGVTIVGVLTFISGALELIGGALLLFLLMDEAVVEQYGGSGAVIAAAIVSIVIGLVIVGIAGGLLNGSPGARLVITVLQVLSLIGGLFLAVAWHGNRPEAIAEWAGVLVSFVILLLLWTRRASEFFRT